MNLTNLSKPQLIGLAVLVGIVFIFILVFLGVIPGLRTSETDPTKVEATLSVWGIGNEQAGLLSAMRVFNQTYPKVGMTYRGFEDYASYELTLLDALAAGRGPDIFAIHNSALPKHINKLIAAPQSEISLAELKILFPQVVEQDFVSGSSVYALPLSIDTLALIYNRDLLDQAAVPVPQTWEEFTAAVPQLVERDDSGSLRRTAAAIGGSAKTVDRAGDFLALLMMQTGTKMVSDNLQSADFDSQEGVNALSFYTQFANSQNAAFTWNDAMSYSIDAMSEERVAMILNYASALPSLRERSAFLNVAVAPMLQPQAAQKAIAYPSYYGYAVSRQSQMQGLAWRFIATIATSPEAARGYLATTQKPPALRSLVNDYANDPILGVFARQILIARSWPQIDVSAASRILSDAISGVVNEGITPRNALGQAENRMTQLLRSVNRVQ